MMRILEQTGAILIVGLGGGGLPDGRGIWRARAMTSPFTIAPPRRPSDGSPNMAANPRRHRPKPRMICRRGAQPPSAATPMCAPVTIRQRQRRVRHHEARGGVRSNHTTASASIAARVGGGGKQARLPLSSMRRCIGAARRGAKNGQLTIMCGGSRSRSRRPSPSSKPMRARAGGWARRDRASSPKWSTRFASPASFRDCRKG